MTAICLTRNPSRWSPSKHDHSQWLKSMKGKTKTSKKNRINWESCYKLERDAKMYLCLKPFNKRQTSRQEKQTAYRFRYVFRSELQTISSSLPQLSVKKAWQNTSKAILCGLIFISGLPLHSPRCFTYNVLSLQWALANSQLKHNHSCLTDMK